MESTTKLTKSISLDYLPMALWTQILSFLPIKSLFILQSVCNFFFAIINNSYFVSLYIRNFRANHNETRILTLKPDNTELRIYYNATGPVDAECVYRGGCELFEWAYRSVRRSGLRKTLSLMIVGLYPDPLMDLYLWLEMMKLCYGIHQSESFAGFLILVLQIHYPIITQLDLESGTTPLAKTTKYSP
ncbi:hypothetical protein V2J09_020256 [Rumex salicifolius]